VLNCTFDPSALILVQEKYLITLPTVSLKLVCLGVTICTRRLSYRLRIGYSLIFPALSAVPFQCPNNSNTISDQC